MISKIQLCRWAEISMNFLLTKLNNTLTKTKHDCQHERKVNDFDERQHDCWRRIANTTIKEIHNFWIHFHLNLKGANLLFIRWESWWYNFHSAFRILCKIWFNYRNSTNLQNFHNITIFFQQSPIVNENWLLPKVALHSKYEFNGWHLHRIGRFYPLNLSLCSYINFTG